MSCIEVVVGVLTIMETAQSKDSDATKKNPKKAGETEDFIFEDIRFKETADGKTRCGVCEAECTKLVAHMNGNKYCTEYFSNMAKFKLEYSKYRDKMSRIKNEGKRKLETNEDIIKNCGKIKQNFESKHSGKISQKMEKILMQMHKRKDLRLV